MEENFNFEIISPEKIIFTGDVSMVTFPSYEGDMSILKNHISIITFLRPGIVKIYKEKNDSEEFFVQDGTVEHFNNSLVFKGMGLDIFFVHCLFLLLLHLINLHLHFLYQFSTVP